MTSAIHNYAQVLHMLAVDRSDVENACDVFGDNEVLLKALSDPRVRFSQKEKTIDRIFSGLMASFVKVLCKNGRISDIHEIFDEYHRICETVGGTLLATVYCVEEPNEAQVKKIKTFLQRKYNAPAVNLEIIRDESLLGGFVIQCGDMRIDRSLKGRFNQLQQKIIGEVK